MQSRLNYPHERIANNCDTMQIWQKHSPHLAFYASRERLHPQHPLQDKSCVANEWMDDTTNKK